MKKNSQHKIAVNKDSVFGIKSKSPLLNGKLLHCLVTTKSWHESYDDWYEQAERNQLLLEALAEKIRDSKDDVKTAYEKEFKSKLKAIKNPQPRKPNKLYTIRMRVIGYDDLTGTYLVEGSTEKEQNKLTKLGY